MIEKSKLFVQFLDRKLMKITFNQGCGSGSTLKKEAGSGSKLGSI